MLHVPFLAPAVDKLHRKFLLLIGQIAWFSQLSRWGAIMQRHGQFQNKGPQSYPTRISSCHSTRRHSTSFPSARISEPDGFQLSMNVADLFYCALEMIAVTHCRSFFFSKPAMS